MGTPPFLTGPFAVFRNEQPRSKLRGIEQPSLNSFRGKPRGIEPEEINKITLNLLSNCGYREEGKFAGANKLTVAAAVRKACGVLLTEGGAGEGTRPREKTTDYVENRPFAPIGTIQVPERYSPAVGITLRLRLHICGVTPRRVVGVPRTVSVGIT